MMVHVCAMEDEDDDVAAKDRELCGNITLFVSDF